MQTELDKIITAFNEFKLTHMTISCPFAPLCIYDDFLEEQGYHKISDWDPNGWEVDFCEDYYNPETKDWISLKGSLYYGNFEFIYTDSYDYDEETINHIIEYDD